MRLVGNEIRIVAKILALIAIFLLLFSPFQTLIKIPVAEAALKCIKDGKEVPWFVGTPCDGTLTQTKTDQPLISGSGLGYALAQVIYVFTVGLGSAVAYVAANVLDFTVHMSLDSAAYALTFVSDGWTTARDIANMAFIFILIYLAMTVMFQAQTAGTMSTLAKVVVVALLINFSFFITRVVIDAGNILSIQFYNAIVADAPTESTNRITSAVAVPDLTAKIMQGINFQNAFKPETFANTEAGNGIGDFGTTFIAFSFIYIALGAMLFILAAAFVAAGIKFIVRIVMLWFAIITAPLAFVAWSFQGGHGAGGHGKNYFGKWRDILISNSFFPAAFLFILLLISNFMGDNGNAGLGVGFVQEALDNNKNLGIEDLGALVANMAVRLGFVVVMLYFAIKASDYIGVAGAGFAKNIGNRFSFGTGAGFTRFVGGGTARLASNLIPDNKVGRVAKAPLNLIAKSSFDMRAPLAKVGLEKEFGKPTGKGGWDAFMHDREALKKKKGKAGEDAAQAEVDHHKEGPAAEAREQAAYRKSFEGGAAAFDRRVSELTEEIKKGREEATQMSQVSLEKMDQAQRKTHQDNLKLLKAQVQAKETQLRGMVNMGQRIVEARNKEHAKEIAIRFIASGNAAKYVVGRKILAGDSKEKKLAQAVKEFSDDGAEGGTPTPATPTSGGAPSGGGSSHSAPSGGPQPTQPAAH